MKPTFKQTEEILNQLPISYYLKRKARVSLSKEENTSFIDLVTGDIVISFSQIEKIDVFSDEELEIDIRNNLYHEVSHAILSPRPSNLSIDEGIFNCFEDERIETLLQDYYLDVNFKEYLYKVYKNFVPKTPLEQFFYYIRLRGGGVELNNEIDMLIAKWKNLHFNVRTQNLYKYQKDIRDLYRKIVQETKSKSEDFSHMEDVKSSSPTVASSEARISEEEMEVIAEDIKSILESYSDKEFRHKAEMIINSRNSERSNNSESKKAYGGKLNPRLIGRPNDDYKWFTKKGDGLYQYDKGLKLNLFIDQSGSYKESEVQTNSMLKELAIIERKIKDFKFDLVVIDKDVELKSKQHRTIECGGGNCLKPELFKIFRNIQDKESKNINLVLFDGDMATDSYLQNGINIKAFSEEQYKNFKAFDTKNTIIISNEANRRELFKYCKRAKIIYTEHYVDELKNYILKSLKILIK